MNVITTIGEVIFEAKTLLRELSDDSRITNRLVYSFLKDNRNLLIKREQDKGKLYNSSAIQTIPLIPMENVDIADSCAVELGYLISKSKYRIPNPLDLSDGSRAIKLFAIDRGSRVEFTTIDKITSNIDRKYKYPGIVTFLENGYLYANKADLSGLKGYGIWSNPEEIQDLNKCISTDCFGKDITCYGKMLEKEFNIPSYLKNACIIKTADDILKRFGAAPLDRLNNAKDDTVK